MRFTFLLVAALLPCLVMATDPLRSIAQDLQALNELHQGRLKFRVDKEDRLVIDHFDGSGHFRQDLVYIEFLDTATFVFDTDEQAIMLACRIDQANCMGKELFRMNTIRRTGRANLPTVASDPEGAHTIALLRSIVRATVQRQVLQIETGGRPTRKR